MPYLADPSNLCFSNDDVLWEFLVVFLAFEVHAFSLCDQGRLLFVDHCCEILLDTLVTCWGLCNNEIQEDNTSDNNHKEPNQPVQEVLRLGEIVRGSEIKITKRYTESGENVPDQESDLLILSIWKAWDVSLLFSRLVSVSEGSWDLLVTSSKHCEDHREQYDQNSKEQGEYFEVSDNPVNHCNNITQPLENSQEEERL